MDSVRAEAAAYVAHDVLEDHAVRLNSQMQAVMRRVGRAHLALRAAAWRPEWLLTACPPATAPPATAAEPAGCDDVVAACPAASGECLATAGASVPGGQDMALLDDVLRRANACWRRGIELLGRYDAAIAAAAPSAAIAGHRLHRRLLSEVVAMVGEDVVLKESIVARVAAAAHALPAPALSAGEWRGIMFTVGSAPLLNSNDATVRRTAECLAASVV